MDNILYIDDFINLYNKNEDTIFTYKPYKKTLRNGLIIDKKKFIKSFMNLLEKYKLKKSLFYENILVITNNLYTKQYKNEMKVILEELNYKNITYLNEDKILDIKNNELYLNCNESYYYFLYRNELKKMKLNIYDNEEINQKTLKYLINLLNKKTVFLYGKKSFQFIKYLNYKNYYVFEETDNLLIKLILNM